MEKTKGKHEPEYEFQSEMEESMINDYGSMLLNLNKTILIKTNQIINNNLKSENNAKSVE